MEKEGFLILGVQIVGLSAPDFRNGPADRSRIIRQSPTKAEKREFGNLLVLLYRFGATRGAAGRLCRSRWAFRAIFWSQERHQCVPVAFRTLA